LSTGLPHRRATELLAAFCLVLAAVLLALPTVAQGRRTACPPAGHLKRGGHHACTGATHARRGHGKRPSAEGSSGRRSASAHPRSGTAGARASHRVSASCEDGAQATLSAQGSLACADGSEPRCEDGSNPARSSAGSPPTCPASAEPESSAPDEATCEDDAGNACAVPSEEPPTQPVCADGGPALQRTDGSHTCGEAVSPHCAEAASVGFSSDGTSFVCTRVS
jgi:hypothetical protein